MTEPRKYISLLLQQYNVEITHERQPLFDEYVASECSIDLVSQIDNLKERLVHEWRIFNRLHDIKNKKINIPNAIAGKVYSAALDLSGLDLNDLTEIELLDLTEIGLSYDKINLRISGEPKKEGDYIIRMLFRIKGEENTAKKHERVLNLLVNPDPKSLWKNIPSDKNLLYWKPDSAKDCGDLGEKKVVAASQRGRSHQNAGSCRDDHYKFSFIEKSGWSVVAVADGAGSSALSRKGSSVACEEVVEYFKQTEELDTESEFEKKIQEYIETEDESVKKKLEVISKQILYKATLSVHKRIKDVADETYIKHEDLFDNPKAKSILDYFHTTLVFALYKKYSIGYVIMTFSVGDCPMAVMNHDKTDTILLNWLDVGEFGGGTRFVTQNEIFHSKEYPMQTRYNFEIMEDFSYLFMMTDGVYDPKFVVEANLKKHEKWIEFLADLHGYHDQKNNKNGETGSGSEDIIGNLVIGASNFFYTLFGQKIECKESSKEGSAGELLKWLDFWDKGNHDDRTIVIIY